METIKSFYTTQELAELTDLTASYIRQLAAGGKIEASKFNGAYIIPREAAEKFIKEREGNK